MKTAASVLALAALAAAVAVMASPTYATAFGADSGERVLRLHGWYDPYLVVSLDVAPATALICALVMVVGVIWGLVRGRMRGWIVIPGIAAAAMLLLTAYDPDAAGFVVVGGKEHFISLLFRLSPQGRVTGCPG